MIRSLPRDIVALERCGREADDECLQYDAPRRVDPTGVGDESIGGPAGFPRNLALGVTRCVDSSVCVVDVRETDGERTR